MRILLWIYILITFISCDRQDDTSNKVWNKNIVSYKWTHLPVKQLVSEKLYFVIEIEAKIDIKIKLSGASGTTLIFPEKNKKHYRFSCPDFISQQAGILSYTLIGDKKILDEGIIKLLPEIEIDTIESYVGPQLITADEDDFSEWILISRDQFDNPNKGSFEINERYYDNHNKQLLFGKAIHYIPVFSKKEKGKIFLETYFNEKRYSQQEIIIYPTFPTDFNINYHRNNKRADGKELTTFSTSVIKDKFGNIIEDGTLITFLIKNNDKYLKAYGKTIHGIASCYIVHPTKASKYIVQGIAPGFAKSPLVELNYIKDE